MIKKDNTKSLLKYYGVLIIFLIYVSFILFSRGEQIRFIESTRNPEIMYYEYTREWVDKELKNYILTNETNYLTMRSTTHLIDDIKSSMYGVKYDSTKFIGAEKVSILDSQYTLDGVEMKVLSTIFVEKQGKKSKLVFLTRVKQDKIIGIDIIN